MDINLRNEESVLTDLPTRDETAALKAAGDNPKLARELVEQLIAGLPQELQDLKQCLSVKDWITLTRIAHRMRGASSYCGVPALESHLEALERVAKTGDGAGVERELARAEYEALRLKSTLTS